MNEKPTHLDLFSGIGGFALAAGWAGFKTIGFCDNEPYAQAILKKHWPEVPIHKDIKELRGVAYRGCALLTGGFPCQPFSNAGKRRGKDDDRHLWPEMLRIIEEAQPAWVIGENVAGIINMELDKVCADLEAKGYEVQPLVIPACGVDAPHKRYRVWIVAKHLADTQSNRTQGGIFESREKRDESGKNDNIVANSSGARQGRDKRIGQTGAERVSSGYASKCSPQIIGDDVAYPESKQSQSEYHGSKQEKTYEPEQGEFRGNDCRELRECNWPTEPNVGRVANGIPNRSHRLKGLGNAIVPQVAYQIIKGIKLLIENEN